MILFGFFDGAAAASVYVDPVAIKLAALIGVLTLVSGLVSSWRQSRRDRRG